ncbi:asparagine synthase-related protein [Vibrio sp. Isolate24]|uniref:asparagine synthetase B family protein n=1 Tax=Vibrio sp. Isolate24 TaxID=2908534 RepID=UPI001EFE86CF|nr:asparagine synthase-related protein [Vibrio sp. Isolate24]MCG9679289.1 asparagine synthetase B [Vibrio sp. Isolate24]
MCGLFLTNDPIFKTSQGNIIEEKLRFRGPDYSSGIIEVGPWKLYHSRLSIIDVESNESNQPMLGSEGGALLFNGEILNFKELSEKYFDGSHVGDTKLLFDLIENDLLDLDELDGFYAFSYINKSGELKYCARDKFGVKPLFYLKREGFVTISSEPSVIKEIHNLNVDMNALEEYKCMRAPVFSNSYFEGIESVTPGSCLIQGTFFDPKCFISSHYEPLEIEQLEQVLKHSVSTRCVSDVPVGLLLSRGIDSNLTKHLGKFTHLYTIGFEGDEDIEYLANQDIKNLTLEYCSPEEYRESFEYLLELRGEPLSVPNEVLLYKIAKRAADEGVKVLLSGEGADEFFGGYDRIFSWAAQEEVFDLETFVEYYCYSKPSKGSYVYQKIEELFQSAGNQSPFELVRWFFIKYHMPVLFRRLDFALMAAGVEGREPLANMHTFLAAMKFAPDSLMTNNKLGKLPLRRAITKYEGEDFAFEKKVGFPVDLRKVYPGIADASSYDIWFQKNIEVLKK